MAQQNVYVLHLGYSFVLFSAVIKMKRIGLKVHPLKLLMTIKNIHKVRFYITFLFLIFMPILQVFFSFFLLLMTYRFEHDLELQYVQKQTNICYQKTVPLCFDVIAKCYKRHRFLPSATLWALSILPQWHLCLPFTRIKHRYSESER